MLFKILKNRLFQIVLLLVIALDQLTKHYAFSFIENEKHYSLLSFVYYQNKNIAFSIPVHGLFVAGMTLLILLIALYCYGDKIFLYSKYTMIFCGCIAGGAIGNIIDRIAYGYVIDFIQISIFPVFNIADIFITVAAIFGLLFYKHIFKE